MDLPLYVIAIVCMTGQPHNCKDIPADEQIPGGILSVVNCFMKAELTGAAWVSEHPGWEFVTGRCTTEKPEPEGRDL